MKLSDLTGIGPSRINALRESGINSLRDLYYYLPIRYEDHRHVMPCSCHNDGCFVYEGHIQSVPKTAYFGNRSKTSAKLTDKFGTIDVCWFNQPWMAHNLCKGMNIRLYGRMREHNGFWSLLNPKIIDDSELMPIYRQIPGFPAKIFRKVIKNAFIYLNETCPEFIPNDILEEYALIGRCEALINAHFPSDSERLSQALKRISFEKILVYQAAVAFHSENRDPSFKFSFGCNEIDNYWRSLSFKPTYSQIKAVEEISEDLKKDFSMHRMLQGDVGSGKTAVAFGAIYLAKQAGYQTAMMAPTEILALQHYQTAMKTLVPLNVRCCLLTGAMKAQERRKVLDDLKSGRCNAIFGTHALISREVEYYKLGLVITDEQHRFGVRQRSALQIKGRSTDDKRPHVLVMSATPIPRTLALILYGDLDISALTDMPPGRMPVKTRIVSPEKREDMYNFLKNEIRNGRQAFVVCPLVRTSEDNESDCSSAKEMYEYFRSGRFSGLKVGLTWGSQNSDEKASILKSFTEGGLDILIATTVIEVGINVPNATIMIVESADRFGLSQLHQLRGRVGRGNEQSWCFLVSASDTRLRILTETADGFEIAKKDLELRGPGDLLGTRQAGEIMNILYSDTGYGLKLFEDATNCIKMLHSKPEKQNIIAGLCDAANEYMPLESEPVALN